MATPITPRDTFARDMLPPRKLWPDFINLDAYHYPDSLNCASALLDAVIDEGLGDQDFIYSETTSWSYLEFQQQANRIAAVLVEDYQLIPGERVLLDSPNSPLMAACWFGIVKAGGIVVATMPMLKGKEMAVICDKAEVRLALGDEKLRDELEVAMELSAPLTHLLCYGKGELEHLMKQKSGHFEAVATAADDVCLIAFTSGTTGVPKGTMHFHRDVMSICNSFCKEVLRPRPEDIFIGSPPLAFTFGLGALLLFPMASRAKTVLLEKPTPDNLAAAIETYGATTLLTAPTAYRHILAHFDDYKLGSLQKCVSAGEPLPKATFDAWHEASGIKLIDGIGATEMLHIFISACGDEIRPGSTGKPIPGFEAKIIDENGQEVEVGEVGRLAVRGPTGCRYLGDDRQAKYVLDGWNITGDAYRMDEDGYYWFQSRADDMIISSGYNIAGPEVENALLLHPAVEEVAVVAKPDEERGSIVKAYIVLADGSRPGDDEQLAELITALQTHVKSTIAPYKYPRAIDFVESLPKTATGKIQRFALRQLESERAGAGKLSN